MHKYLRNLFSFFLVVFLYGCSTSYYLRDGLKKNVEDADESKIEYRILLIGDAGEPSPDLRESVLRGM